MSEYLAPDELVELTELRMASAQIRWLRDRGWKFEVGQLTGRPKVAREYYRARMCSLDPLPAVPGAPTAGPAGDPARSYTVRPAKVISLRQ